jgi:hypothetical protein
LAVLLSVILKTVKIIYNFYAFESFFIDTSFIKLNKNNILIFQPLSLGIFFSTYGIAIAAPDNITIDKINYHKREGE